VHADSRAGRFLDHLNRFSGGIEPVMYRVDSTHEGQGPITSIVYNDLPEPGCLTAITYGLSLSTHRDWLLGKPELIISVRSTDIAWALAVAIFAEELRGACPFSYGGTLDHGERIAAESEMSAFVTFAPGALDPPDAEIDLVDCKVFLTGCYPIHESERQFIQKRGLEEFWKLEWDVMDVRRRPVA
jgi:Suppressor of fused protein (SUFU)